MRNIEKVLANHVCTGCGICENICPHHCINTRLDSKRGHYITTLNLKQCIDCGLCQKVCPVYTWNNRESNPYVGEYCKIYSGYSMNEQHRISSASGGMTTSILAYLLSSKTIEAAVVAVRNEERPLESELRIVSTNEDVCASKGSVYSPTSYCDIISEIKESSFSKFAVVGLPCHVEGLMRLCEMDKKLREKIILKIALVCGHTPTINAYNYSLRHLNIKVSDVVALSNRGEGWPGYMQIKTCDETITKVPYGSKYSWGQTLGSPCFTPSGCKHCSDVTGYHADISICDAWLPQYSSDKKGRNLLLIRSEIILKILNDMYEAKIVELSEESVDNFIVANKSVFKEKLHINSIRNSRLKQIGLFPNVEYLKIEDPKTSCLICLLLMSEKIFCKLPINDLSLLFLKVFKYLSVKWIKLRIF